MELLRHMELVGHATTTAMLRDAGFSQGDVRRFVREGRLISVQRGAFVIPDDTGEGTFLREHVAVVRSLALPYALSDQSAAVAWGLPLLRGGLQRHHLTPAPHGKPGVVNPRTSLHTPVLAPLRALPAPYDDILAVPPAVVCCQLAIRQGTIHGVVAADRALHTRVCTQEELAEATGLTGLVRNLRRARSMVLLTDVRSESVAESIFRVDAALAGVQLEAQVDVHDHAGFVGRVDFRLGSTIFEIDGAVKYDGAEGRDALVAEKRREDRLRALGYRVVRLMWSDLTPERIRRVLREALRAAGSPPTPGHHTRLVA